MLTSSQKVMTMAGPIFIHTHLIISIDTSQTDLYRQKLLESLLEICATNSMGLSLLVFMQLFF